MKKTVRKNGNINPEKIARMADEGKDISQFFTNTGVMRHPIKRVNVDFTKEMLEEIDQIVTELNISRQAFIKTSLRNVLLEHYSLKLLKGVKGYASNPTFLKENNGNNAILEQIILNVTGIDIFNKLKQQAEKLGQNYLDLICQILKTSFSKQKSS